MKRRIVVLFCLLLIISLCSCGEHSELKHFSKECGIELENGEIVSFKDSHGGFHGDGVSLMKVRYTDSSMVGKMAESKLWHEFPLSDNIQTFIDQTYDPNLFIPEIKSGYYYFYDRHTESSNPYDNSDLLERYSFNFTLALYDTDENILYLCKYDT